MPDLLLTNVQAGMLQNLHQRAASHQRSPEEEAKAILADVLKTPGSNGWTQVDDIYHRLAASGRLFTDSVDLLREDRDR